MLTREEDIDVHALRRQGMSISAIARHLGRDRKTIRAYLAGGRVAGERKPAEADPFEAFVDYVRARLTEDPHLWAVTLFDEVAGLGYDRSYPTFTRQLRARGLRPHCEPCSAVDALDKTTRKLGGLTRKWRFDRMSTVCHPESGKVTVTFAAVAKYYGVQVAICPPRRGNRKGVVEKSNHTAAQRWWRTLPDDTTVEEAQASLDRFCELRGDARLRPSAVDRAARVLTIAEQEPLAPVPTAPFPATISEERTVSAQALVAWRGNFYSVPPELARARVVAWQRLGAQHLDIATSSGIVIARHQLAPDGAGVMVRDHGHVIALEQLVLAGHDTSRPHRRKERIPPGPAARAAADALRARQQPDPVSAVNDDVVIDLAKYDRAANGRNTLT